MEALLAQAASARREGDLDAAEALYRHLLAQAPADPRPRYGLSHVLLQRGAWREAWPLYESRRELLSPRSMVKVAGDEWTGGPVAGAKIAVVAEQGLGDQIMFGRYLAELTRLGAEVTVALTVGNSASLFERLGYRIATAISARPVAGVDVWTYFGSLPLRLEMPTPPDPVYIDLPQQGGGGIGVVATGDPFNSIDRFRSLPPALAERLCALGRNLHPSATGVTTMLETATIAAGLDLVITVDTAVAHLALSMGKPTWVLLSQLGMDHRYNNGCRSLWYPEARLIRQAREGEWEPVLEQVETLVRGSLPA